MELHDALRSILKPSPNHLQVFWITLVKGKFLCIELDLVVKVNKLFQGRFDLILSLESQEPCLKWTINFIDNKIEP